MKIKTFLALTAGMVFSCNASSCAEESSAGKFEPLAINLSKIDWGLAAGGNGFPVGVRSARQGIDPLTGGITYYAKFPAGSHFDLHWHTHDEFVVVVQGSVTIVLGEQSHRISNGGYIVIPGKLTHSWDVPIGEEAVIVVRRGGPADFNFVEHQPEKQREQREQRE